ncbi:MAG: hypothetical protein QNJ67_08155 [Kiloniellales bacterium]|nr:hypothetical protein [Kiloniellales bacterium]
MLHHYGIRTRRLLVHGALGTIIGSLAVIVVLTLNVFGLGTMVSQMEHATFHLSIMLFKPSMLFGVAAVGLSMLLQLQASAGRPERRVAAVHSRG